MSEDWEDGKDLAVVKGSWEDEEEEVKDSWDIDEEEEVVVESVARPVPAAKPAEKSKKTKQQAPTIVMEDNPNETPQERKARLERLVQERDLENAMSLFGIGGSAKKDVLSEASAPIIVSSPFETMNPTSIAEFDQFTRILTKRLEAFESSKHYPLFLEGLVNALMGRRDVPEIRKVAGILSDMATVKSREKQLASKAKPPPSLKGVKKSSRYDDFEGYEDGDGFDE